MEVHAPEHAIHTWREFFIHMGTICLGLLIAIALEQSVEALHHRHQMHESRERILEEIGRNRELVARDRLHLQDIANEMKTNITLLRDEQSGHPSPGGTLNYAWDNDGFLDAAFQFARSNGSLDRMPYEQAKLYADAYGQQAIIAAEGDTLLDRLSDAQSVSMRGHTIESMTPAELEEAIQLCSGVLARLHYVDENLVVADAEYKLVLDTSNQKN
jgi:hypothetical protein